jgi:hypothetical protein
LPKAPVTFATACHITRWLPATPVGCLRMSRTCHSWGLCHDEEWRPSGAPARCVCLAVPCSVSSGGRGAQVRTGRSASYRGAYGLAELVWSWSLTEPLSMGLGAGWAATARYRRSRPVRARRSPRTPLPGTWLDARWKLTRPVAQSRTTFSHVALTVRPASGSFSPQPQSSRGGSQSSIH